ncbi:MAG: hypothetical protein ACI8RD_001398 [Bacillariaceae sp.]|jgi:hypothetical protein
MTNKWWSCPPPEIPPPKLNKPDTMCHQDRKSGKSSLCVRCQVDDDAEQKQLEAIQAKEASEKMSKKQKKQSLRDRMRKRAKK